MKTTIKELFSSRIAVLAVVLAAILGVCAFSFSSIQQNAWADEGEDTIFTKEWDAFTNEGNAFAAENEAIAVRFDFEARTITVTNKDAEKDLADVVLTVVIPEAQNGAYSITQIAKNGGVATLDMPDDLSAEAITQVTLAPKPPEAAPKPATDPKPAADPKPEGDDQGADQGEPAAANDPGPADGDDPAPLGNDPAPQANDPAAGDPEPAANPAEATVSFVMNDHGAQPGDIAVTIGEAIQKMPDDPAADGWKFLGWFTDKELTKEFDAASKINADTTLYAKWEENAAPAEKITITFEMNGHGDTPDPLDIIKGSVAGEFTAPAVDGYTFEGWFTDKDLTKAYNPKARLASDTTLYAKWEENADADPEPEPAAAPAPKSAPAPVTTFSIVISKTDARMGQSLSDADFTLKDAAGNVITSWTTDGNDVVIDGLDRGTTYVLSETKAPAGYNRERDININFTDEDGSAVVKIDQGGNAVALANNNDGIASLNVKDLSGTTLQGASTSAPRTGDNQNMPLISLCFAAVALIAGGVAATAHRKRHGA